MIRAIFIVMFMVVAFLGNPTLSYARSALDQYCDKKFKETNVCREELCQTRCYGGLDYPGCDIECYGKDCAAIVVNQCPSPTCQIVKGCDGRKRCLPDDYAEGDTCGVLGYVGDKLECCEGLVKKCGIPLFDGSCDEAPERSIYAAPMCLPCGNGKCDVLENRCNCPEDCGLFKD